MRDNGANLTPQIQALMARLRSQGVSISAIEDTILSLPPVPAPFSGAGSGDGIVGDPGGSASTRYYRDDGTFSALVLENRTSDPGSPATGQLWLRTDL